MISTSRRVFLRTSALALATISADLNLITSGAGVGSSGARRHNPKGIMWDTIPVKGSIMERMEAVRAAGFDAVEMASHLDQQEVLKARDETGLKVVSVCGAKHWAKPLSDPNDRIRAEGLEALKQTIRDAAAYGATSILLVPGVVNKDVTFEECSSRSIEQIKLALPLAKESGVTISIENVWNNFITTPEQAVSYLQAINSPQVGWHFDAGNIIRYGDPIEWIKALGSHLKRVHIKEYSRDLAMRTDDVWKGFKVSLLHGANNWSGIMKALDEVGYTGPLITEQGGSLEELSQALDKIMTS